MLFVPLLFVLLATPFVTISSLPWLLKCVKTSEIFYDLLFIISKSNMTSSGCTKEEIKHILITSHAFSCKSNLITALAYRSLACSVFREVIIEVGTRCLNTDNIINNINNN